MTTSTTFRQFIQARQITLTKRSQKTYAEVLDLFDHYLQHLGLNKANGLQANLEPTITALENFMDDYLIAVLNAEKDFLRSAEVVIRDLHKWLRGQRKPIKNPSPVSTLVGA